MTSSTPKKKTSGVGIGSLSSALLLYRVFAFITGVVLTIGTIALIVESLRPYGQEISWLGPLWIAHGYFYMAYVLVTLNVAVHLRWHPVRAVLTMAAGTVPTASFVAERIVSRQVRKVMQHSH